MTRLPRPIDPTYDETPVPLHDGPSTPPAPAAPAPTMTPAAAPGVDVASPPAFASESDPGPELQGQLGNGVSIVTEAEVHADIMREDHTLPVVLLIACTLMTIFISAGQVLGEAGVVGAAAVGVATFVGLGAVIVINTPAAWLVGKMFGEDFGSFPVLALRVGAVNATQMLVGLGLSTVLSPIVAMLAGFPIFLALAVWLIGMNLLQAIVFSVTVTVINLLLLSFVVMSLAALVMGA
jgi:hypothetical protein